MSKVEGTMSRSPTPPTLVNDSKLLAKILRVLFPISIYPTRGLHLHVGSGPPFPSISLYIYSPSLTSLSPPCSKHTLPPFRYSSSLKQHSSSSKTAPRTPQILIPSTTSSIKIGKKQPWFLLHLHQLQILG